MKYLELIVSGKSERYMLQAPDEMKISDVIKNTVRVKNDFSGSVKMYHFRSGRFLDDRKSVAQNGVESGDTLMLFICT